MPIMCFFMPDESGKTSLARRMVLPFAKRGCKVRTSWMRGTHMLSFSLVRNLHQCKVFKSDNPNRISVPAKLRQIWNSRARELLIDVYMRKLCVSEL